MNYINKLINIESLKFFYCFILQIILSIDFITWFSLNEHIRHKIQIQIFYKQLLSIFLSISSINHEYKYRIICKKYIFLDILKKFVTKLIFIKKNVYL